MKHVLKSTRLSILSLVAVLFAGLATAAASQDRFENGATALFAGHSFFAPIAKEFDVLARQAGLSDHSTRIVFQGGRKGAPGALWDNSKRRSEIEAILASGNVELFGLAGMGGQATYDDFANWVDLALRYNPDTAFFIPQTYISGGPRTETRRLGKNTVGSGQKIDAIVSDLARAYPSTRFFYVNSGIIAPIMKAMFEQGMLEDLDAEVAREGEALYRDKGIGHAGKMMEHVMAIFWLETLYGTRIVDSTRYSAEDVTSILNKANEINTRVR